MNLTVTEMELVLDRLRGRMERHLSGDRSEFLEVRFIDLQALFDRYQELEGYRVAAEHDLEILASVTVPAMQARLAELRFRGQ